MKVHFGKSGDVTALHSSHEPDITASPTPAVSVGQAAQAVARDLGGGAKPPSGGTLVYLPVPKTGEVRLAWKFVRSAPGASWRYYIDAQTGEVLFRYDNLRYACPGGTFGTVTGEVYDVDPSSSGIGENFLPTKRPIPNQNVWQYNIYQTTYAVTGPDGTYCNTGTQARVFTALQGPYVSVSNFNLDSARYDNGQGVWSIAQTPVNSPSPYSNGTTLIPSNVFGTDIHMPSDASLGKPAGEAVMAVANFSFFDVGALDTRGDIVDDDQVHVYNAQGRRIASYIGSTVSGSPALPRFHSAPVAGCLKCDDGAGPGHAPMHLELWANQDQAHQGFAVSVSSYLFLTNKTVTPGTPLPYDVSWTSANTADSTRDEISIFYHMNRMHDYFIKGDEVNGVTGSYNQWGGVDKSSEAWISTAVVAMAHFGPHFGNAFYNADHDNFAIGDDPANLALDATVIHHEYTHFVIEKIAPILNFGQDGAISEGVADYFSASSLNDPHIGAHLNGSGEGALRELACVSGSGGNTGCKDFPADWSGEIHEDSLPLSQALWEIRQDLIGTLDGPVDGHNGMSGRGKSCADGLIFQAHFYYPNGFQEFEDAMLQVDSAGTIAACGGQNVAQGTIMKRFGNHMTLPSSADAYEPNDGLQSAVDITTLPAVAASIYPAADMDYYSFAAGPGRVRLTLSLPAATGSSYFAYGMQLIDKNYHIIATAWPALDVNPLNGMCPDTTGANSCQTSQGQVVLDYDNPAGSLFYLLITAAPTDAGSNSAANSPLPYTLQLSANGASTFDSTVNAKVDNDVISFTVNVSSFATQNLLFDHAQLRDHDHRIVQDPTDPAGIPDACAAVTPTGPCPARFLAVVGTPVSANGVISGKVQLQTYLGKAFSARYPALGTVYLEVFGISRLDSDKTTSNAGVIPARTESLGQSQPLNLGTNSGGLTAYNNIFHPEKGEVATFKYDLPQAGHVRLQLFTRAGSLVSTVYDGDGCSGQAAGQAAACKGSVDWNGRNSAGNFVASGIYVLRLEVDGSVRATQKVAVVK
ncbi:MAG: hypothetical protein NTX64_08010 [Elusimicrobia bacterium]|nr:hypothetical protein [Elusimicrobiota bacterium]